MLTSEIFLGKVNYIFQINEKPQKVALFHICAISLLSGSLEDSSCYLVWAVVGIRRRREEYFDSLFLDNCDYSLILHQN